MRHFSDEQWQIFKEGMCPENIGDVMADHLVACDSCRNLYLSLIGEDEISQGAEQLSPDFSQQVIKGIKVQEKKQAAKKKKNRSRQGRNNPVYFAAAAAITLILMGGGFFQSLAQSIPQFATGSVIVEHSASTKVDWPDKLVDQASNWMHNFETQDRGGL